MQDVQCKYTDSMGNGDISSTLHLPITTPGNAREVDDMMHVALILFLQHKGRVHAKIHCIILSVC